MESQNQRRKVVPRACRNCRARKVTWFQGDASRLDDNPQADQFQIRCNRESPCSNCITSKISCPVTGSTIPQPSPTPGLSRGDESVDSLADRISALENALRDHLRPRSTVTDQQTPTRYDAQDEQFASFEGNSSFTRQTRLACQVDELDAASVFLSPSVINELATLRGGLEHRGLAQETGGRHLSVAEQAPKMKLPPSDFVLRLLRCVSDKESILVLFYPVENLGQVEDLCRRAYFPISPIQTGELVLLNGMLSVLLSELMHFPQPGICPEEVEYAHNICMENFEVGIETYEIMAVPRYENALALCMAVQALKAQMNGNLLQQRRLASAAANHCCTLGYHQEAMVSGATAQESNRFRRLFWHVYLLDKSLALSLGRAPIIQDYDVDVQPIADSHDPRRSPWDAAFSLFVEFSMIQAEIYQKLFSPASRRLGDEARHAIVDDLSKRLNAWHEAWLQIDSAKTYRKELFDCTFKPTDVIYYSVLTLLHRGSNLSTSTKAISQVCFEAAQKGLQAHATTYTHYAQGGPIAVAMYANWVHAYASFTPYIVTFLHCIRYSSTSDLRLLEETLGIMRQISCQVNTYDRHYKLFNALYCIAKAYVGSRKAIDGEEPSPESTVILPPGLPSGSNSQPMFATDVQMDVWHGSYFEQLSFAIDCQLGNQAV
ncbi:hypothetical protein BKA56DRAFT_622339 [Ilyonectria sp. MPI-CAGE-AT-0026]|nr:hypothetical protein BKA56DRAFT_622339 [Ilyonectria sp. MPI-CAGE-AT-0026]